ncbi:hypothetical protein ABPG74_007592 [Tetrahymena malaccensis]
MSVTIKQNKSIRNFNETFWLKIRDELRIYVIQEKRPKKILKLYELGEEDVCVDRKKIRQWSEQAEILINEIMENGYADFICNRDHILEVFKNINFINLQINEMDEELLKFPNIEILNLNKNIIKTVENIPKSLKELHLFSNHITEISPRLKTANNLLYLGLGYNQMKDNAIVSISRYFPQLVALDISNNFFEDIELVLENVEKFKNLRLFNCQGNPICLLSNYKKSFVYAIPDLEIIDNKRITPNDKQVTSDSSNQKSPNSNGNNNQAEYLQEAKYDSQKPTMNDLQQIYNHPNHSFKLRIAINTLENIPEGIILDKSQYPKFDEKPESFQTCYYTKIELDAFEDPSQNIIDSRPKVIERLHRVREQKVKERLEYIRKQEEELKKQQELQAQQALQAQQQAGKKGAAKAPAPSKKDAKDAGKIDIPPEIPPVNPNLEGRALSEDICKDDDIFRVDMQIDFDVVLPVSSRVRDFFRKGMIVKLFKSEPIMVQVAEGDDEKQPQINQETGFPVLQEILIGVFKIDLEQFLNDGTLPRISQFKYPIFYDNVLKVPEYFYPFEDEQKLIQKNNDIIKELLKKQEDAEKPPEPEIVDPKKKDPKKKEVKKVDKKPPPKKGAKEEEVKKVVPLSTFPSHNRQYIFVDKENIYLPLRKLQISSLVQIY